MAELQCTHDLSSLELSCNVGPSKASANNTRIYFQSSRPLSQRLDSGAAASEQPAATSTLDDSQLEHVMRDWIAAQTLQEDPAAEAEEAASTTETPNAVPCTHAMVLAPALYHILAAATISESIKAQAAKLLGYAVLRNKSCACALSCNSPFPQLL